MFQHSHRVYALQHWSSWIYPFRISKKQWQNTSAVEAHASNRDAAYLNVGPGVNVDKSAQLFSLEYLLFTGRNELRWVTQI